MLSPCPGNPLVNGHRRRKSKHAELVQAEEMRIIEQQALTAAGIGGVDNYATKG